MKDKVSMIAQGDVQSCPRALLGRYLAGKSFLSARGSWLVLLAELGLRRAVYPPAHFFPAADNKTLILDAKDWRGFPFCGRALLFSLQAIVTHDSSILTTPSQLCVALLYPAILPLGTRLASSESLRIPPTAQPSSRVRDCPSPAPKSKTPRAEVTHSLPPTQYSCFFNSLCSDMNL